MIAAICLVHDATLATRNVRDFDGLDLKLVNPFEADLNKLRASTPSQPGRRMPLRVIFMGTPEFSVPTLRAIAEAGHEIVAVYTQPPRPPDGAGWN